MPEPQSQLPQCRSSPGCLCVASVVVASATAVVFFALSSSSSSSFSSRLLPLAVLFCSLSSAP